MRKSVLFTVTLLVALGAVTVPSVVGSAHPAKTTYTFQASADAQVRIGQRSSNFGASRRLSVEAGRGTARDGLLRFDADIPEGRKVVSATVRLHSLGNRPASESLHIYTTEGGWDEDEVAWKSAPGVSSWLARASVADDSWVEWDVTAGVPASGGQANFRIKISTGPRLYFASKQHRTAALRPQLVIRTAPADSEDSTSDDPSGNPEQKATPTEQGRSSEQESGKSGTSPGGTPSSGTSPNATEPLSASGLPGTAATNLGWGPVVAGDEFNYSGVPDPAKWRVYDSKGHAGQGLRSPSQMSVDGSQLVITGKPDGTTGGMSAKFDRRKYGRWEARLALPAGDDEYHGVALLWPDSGSWPCDGEIDYAENTGDRSTMSFFHHYSCSNKQTSARRSIDARQFHNYAVEWTPTHIRGFIDGVQWFEDKEPSHQPPGPMHQTLQLDWFPDDTPNGSAQMMVDWVRVYDLATATSSGGLAPAGVVPPAAGMSATAAATGEDVVIAAVGDINPDGNTSANSHSGRNAAAIASGLANGSIDAFVGIGDFQYTKGYCADLVNEWSKLWGPVLPRTYWTAGPNHDYEPGVNEDLSRFMNGECPGSTAKSATNAGRGFVDAMDFYSFDLGRWHVAVLPSVAWRYDEARAEAMTARIDADLAAARAAGKHLAAVLHDPYFSSNTEAHTRATQVKPWVDVLWKHRVRLTLSGSQHNYERSCPVNNADQCVADGMTAFQVSTGGIGLRNFSSSPSYIAHRFSDTWGHLALTLKADGGFSWSFRPVGGAMKTDSGSRPAA